MASPKTKITRSRRGMRRSHNALNKPTVIHCDNCGSMKQPHHICSSCGYYKGREVLAPQA